LASFSILSDKSKPNTLPFGPTAFQNALAVARAQQSQSRLANGRFAPLGQQIINAADFVVERLGLVFGLENPKNGGMSVFRIRVHI
jgi:hypothetical protein